MDEEALQKIATLYGLHAVLFSAAQKGYRNECYALKLADGRILNFIKYKSEPGIVARIRRANMIGDAIATAGLPARRTFSPKLLRLQRSQQTSYGALYEYLPGETIPWEAYTMKHIKALGASLAALHAVLHDIPQATLPAATDEYHALCGRMNTYFSDKGVARAVQQKLKLSVDASVLATFQTLLTRLHNTPGQQPLHMDFVRSNILFNQSGEITGILDFEKTAYGLPEFDIARTLAFLLVDCKYKPEDKVRKYFLQSGYRKHGGGTLRLPPSTVESLISLFLLHDFYKFLKHNPYESLKANEHFTRTRDFLLKRNILVEAQMLQ